MDFEDAHVTPGYFAVLRQPLLAGREFTIADGKDAPNVAVVNLMFAKRFFGSPQNALGRQIGEGSKPDTTIVGVVGDVKHQDLRSEIVPSVYRPYAQMKHPVGLTIYVRTTPDPTEIQQAIRRAVHELDPTLVVDGLRTMDEQVTRTAADARALATLAIGFSVLALLLAAVGLYGVLAYSTEQRTREIGVRLALGAPRSGVMILIVREMALIAGIAIAVALPSVVGLAQLFRTELYGVTAADPLALAGAVVLTVVMIVLAAALPARRAAAVEPMQALRTE
jgi:putative ABC transport system permease protein